MFGNAVPSLLQHVRRLAATASSDEQLLADFLARRSDEAFAALIGRHGPMVLNVCRRVLHDAHAAEDVFQATFLVLADRAGAIHQRASLAGFLHGVGFIVNGHAGGELTLRNGRGSITVDLEGSEQPGFSPLPQDFVFSVVGGTGAYRHADGVGFVDIALHPDQPHHGHFTVIIASPVIDPPPV